MPALRVTLALFLWAGALGGAAACGGNPPPRTERPPAQLPAATPRAPSGDASGPRRARPDADAAGSAAWTIAAVVERLAGTRIHVGDRTVPIDAATLTCGGEGRARRRGGALLWTRFRCVQPTFPAGAVAGPDAVFVVVPTSPRTLVVRGGRFAT